MRSDVKSATLNNISDKFNSPSSEPKLKPCLTIMNNNSFCCKRFGLHFVAVTLDRLRDPPSLLCNVYVWLFPLG